MATEAASKINTADTIKILLFLAAVIAVLTLVYFVFVRPVTKIVAGAPAGAFPFLLGGLAGTWFGKKFLGGSAVNPTPNANAAAATTEQAATETAATDTAAAGEGEAATAAEDIGAAGLEEAGGAALTEEVVAAALIL